MRNKKGKRNRFRDLEIKQKFLLMNLGIIIIMLAIFGCCSYFVSRKSLMDSSLHTSEILMEQLGQNVENNIKFLDDFLLQEIMQFDLGDILNTGQSYITYNQRREAKQFSFNLMNYNKYIRAVILEDFQDKRYVYSEESGFQSFLQRPCGTADSGSDCDEMVRRTRL